MSIKISRHEAPSRSNDLKRITQRPPHFKNVEIQYVHKKNRDMKHALTQ